MNNIIIVVLLFPNKMVGLGLQFCAFSVTDEHVNMLCK